MQPGELRSIIDYHYFYKNEYKIIVEQDEREHSNGRYPVADELKGLIGREKFAGLPALIIRNNCRDDELQDPLQVRTIDAIINEYKAAVDRDDPFVRKSIIVFIDYREVSPHLAALPGNFTTKMTSGNKSFLLNAGIKPMAQRMVLARKSLDTLKLLSQIYFIIKNLQRLQTPNMKPLLLQLKRLIQRQMLLKLM